MASALLATLFVIPAHGALGQPASSRELRVVERFRAAGGGGPMAFEGKRFISQGGRAAGFASYRISAANPFVRTNGSYECPADGHSISLWHGFVIQSTSVPSERSSTCNNTDESAGKEGIRIVDARDASRARQVKFFPTECGSYGHTLMPVGRIAYIYDVHHLPACTDSPTNPEPLYMRVFRFDPEHPRRAEIVGQPDSGFTEACDRLSVHVERALLACTSLNRLILFDVSDPPNPREIGLLTFNSGLLWESSFSWDGNYLVIGQWGGTGSVSSCDVLIVDVRDPSVPVESGRLSPPRTPDSCSSPWSVGVIPMKDPNDRLAVVGWRSEGVSIVDFSEPTAPVELAHYGDEYVERAYWYNGRIYGFGSLKSYKGIVLKLEGTGRRSAHFLERYTPHTQYADFTS